MKFPFGPRQPNQKISEDLLAATTPEGLIDQMKSYAREKGSPLHDKHYVGHAMDVTDVPLSKFFLVHLEPPPYVQKYGIPKGTLSFANKITIIII